MAEAKIFVACKHNIYIQKSLKILLCKLYIEMFVLISTKKHSMT